MTSRFSMIAALALVLTVSLMTGIAAAQDYEFKIGHSMPTDTTRHEATTVFKKYVEKESKGQIKVTIFHSGQLGTEEEMLEALKMGGQEGYLGGVFDSITPKLNLYIMPFLYADQAALQRVAKSPMGEKIAKDAENLGVKVLAVGDAGSRNFTNNIREIKTPADMKGLKMRTPPVEAIIKTMEALGANPVSIPYVETYMALKTGVADGEENPFMNIATMKFHEVQKYMTVVHYLFNPEPFCVNLDWYNSLPENLQKIMQDGAWLYTETQDKLRAESSDSYLKIIKDGGVKVYFPSDAERKMFVEKCKPVYDYYINKKKFFTQEELDEVIKISKGE